MPGTAFRAGSRSGFAGRTKPWRFDFRRAEGGTAGERGSAVLDFVLVGALMTFIFLSVVQLMLVLHVRNVLIDAAASGARYGSLADRTSDDAKARTVELITGALNSGFTDDVEVAPVDLGGVPALEVKVSAPWPVIGLVGSGATLEVTGHALLQQGHGR